MLGHESLLSDSNGLRSRKTYETYGFAYNYGLAGLVLRQKNIDLLIGTDKPGSYMNHLYHTFIQPDQLFVEVAI